MSMKHTTPLQVKFFSNIDQGEIQVSVTAYITEFNM